MRQFVLRNQPPVEASRICRRHTLVPHVLQRIDAGVVSPGHKNGRYASRSVVYVRTFANHDVLGAELRPTDAEGAGTADKKIKLANFLRRHRCVISKFN